MQHLKDKIKKNKFVVGTWCELPSPELINVEAKAGLDFVIIDMEHGSMDFSVASKMIMAAQADNCSPIIRVDKNDEASILRALEIGPEGIIVPHIQSKEDRQKAITYAKFPPIGERSLNPFTRSGDYHVHANYTQTQNDRSVIGLVVEGIDGINNLESIIDNSVDIIYIGTYDISQAFNLPNDVSNKKIQDTIKKMVTIIRKKNKIAGCMFHNKKELELFKKLGIQFLCYKVDTSVIYDEFRSIKESL